MLRVCFVEEPVEFWGRQRELARLRAELDEVIASGQGRMLAVRGRRQVGKSRLLTELVETADVPYLYATAFKNAPARVQVAQVADDMRTSRVPLPDLEAAFAATPTSWQDLFARLPLAFGGQPAIVVLDEFPWATETDDTLEGVLQAAWDRTMERLPVLVVLVGSDLAMMERLTEHDRPLYGRAREMVVSALSPAEVAEAFGGSVDSMGLFDMYLATGGYPRLVSAARAHDDVRQFVTAQLQDDQSPLAVTGLRMLDAEFRDAEQARAVLEAIGAVEVGHATFSSAVAQLAGDESAAGTAVSRALPTLVEAKRVVAIDTPVGASARSRLRRYRIVDPYLRFWFRYCRPHLADIARGRADLAIGRFERDFVSWRGKAIEPVVHDAVARLAATDPRMGGVEHVGAWWGRTNEHEFDVVGLTRDGAVPLLGTVKWRARKPVSPAEATALADGRAVVPMAAGARLLAVCPAGARADAGVDAVLGADDLVAAFD
jgi:uncharacterized protein